MHWLVFVILTQTRHIWEDWPVGKSLGVFLTNGYRGKAQLTHYGWCYPWTTGPELYKEPGRASHEE